MLSLAVSAAALALIFTNESFQPIQAAIGFAVLGYQMTTSLIPAVTNAFLKRGLGGRDLSKPGKPLIPETMGVIPAITYMFVMILFIPFMFIFGSDQNGLSGMFPHKMLSTYLGCLLSLMSMILLGLLDDLFDIRWRHKFFLPAVASIPQLIVYYVDFGVTAILIPHFLQQWLHLETNSVDLGYFYYFYMASVAIFCPNSVNILAGINGLEVGQTVVIAALLLLNDVFYLSTGTIQSPSYSIHLLSMCFLIPFVGIALGLLKYNWFPARVFVGDTWCYFGGMVFAVVGISGHFAKTLMLFFLLQIVNFVYSAPQLFGLIPCPRHRLPKFNEEDGLLYNSYTEYGLIDTTSEKGTQNPPLNSRLVPVVLFLEKLKLIGVVKEYQDGKWVIRKTTNLTIINLFIVWTGPIKEDKLCTLLLATQFATGFIMLILRHTLAPMLFGFDNSWSMLNRYN
ncbi:hypothetical protein KL933_003689 [Ogataea haglerorum]|uniref:UDP-N-acetylglucosamine--dolichyl-phosphate N-acetylglucosaminephosphotransferase n=1 Tax=Ogataea haglerorum TaxID=1937702 RepID=A0AAN6D3L7_9ASCO|nr:uncharacterized protein KL911_003948 [Ogataea haglerorum]KAG7694490.1 hypothetical protein KL915_003457 [Ogataea haglerorum]KAG7705174.1 hypothetical protein KL914_003860 [Ogataea haglerorum]KAG7705431.1 hypothetical protein KL950_003867 [Ogataea haglerorum]KAG7716700.1 hypothetical protein KL913_003216 [Ogataea haglerorum]KAG7717547.1 hypothetical protein KL949_003381 [Ogataea haglerorum]